MLDALVMIIKSFLHTFSMGSPKGALAVMNLYQTFRMCSAALL